MSRILAILLLIILSSCTIKLKVKGMDKIIPDGGIGSVKITTPILYVGEGINDFLSKLIAKQLQNQKRSVTKEFEYMDSGMIDDSSIDVSDSRYIDNDFGVEDDS